MSRTHYEHFCRAAREIERRTGFFVRIDHRSQRMTVGPEFSPFGCWSDSVFDSEGMARHFRGWRDDIGVDDIVYFAVLANQTAVRKKKWLENGEKKKQAKPVYDGREEAHREACRVLAEKRKRRVYSGV